jgi:hypothetical protein
MHQGPSPDPQPPSQSAQPPDYPAQHYFPGSAPRTSPRRPPIDVIVLAISALIIAVLGLWLPLFGSIFAALFFGAMGLGWGPIAVLGLIASLALATAIGEITFGIAAWWLRPWVWTVGVVSQGLYMLTYLLAYLLLITQFGPRVDSTDIFYAVIAGSLLLYLLTPRVRRLFGHKGFRLWVAMARVIALSAVLCGTGVGLDLLMWNKSVDDSLNSATAGIVAESFYTCLNNGSSCSDLLGGDAARQYSSEGLRQSWETFSGGDYVSVSYDQPNISGDGANVRVKLVPSNVPEGNPGKTYDVDVSLALVEDVESASSIGRTWAIIAARPKLIPDP